MATLSLFEVSRAGRHYLVTGETYMQMARAREPWATRHATRHEAELQAARLTSAIVEQAEEFNARIDLARAYLATRCARAAMPAPQLSLF